MSTDFFDEDLRSSRAEASASDASEDVPVRSITEAGISRMARQKEQLGDQVAGAIGEIERLRLRQNDLEREKMTLEDLTRKQDAYEQGKREMIDKLEASIVLLEKDETQATRSAELLSVIRGRFKETLDEMTSIDEDKWPGASFQDELNKALAQVDDARKIYRRGLAKIEASGWGGAIGGKEPPAIMERVSRDLDPTRSFGFWMKVGMAVSLPVILVSVLIFIAWVVVWLVFNGYV